MKFEEWVKGIENAAIKGLCSTHPNICKMIYNEGQKDIEKALKEKGVCLQSELDEAKDIIRQMLLVPYANNEEVNADITSILDKAESFLKE
jgi:hypothetical protein